MTANGTINAGYNDNYGSDIESSHGLGFGGVAALNGFFYNPNFLNFNINPYYNQSRSNSGTGSISDASGVTLNSGIFGGSHFPGSVNYSTAFNSTGNYGIPGISSLNTNGNSQNFGINWGAFVPGLPTLSVGYQMGSSNYYLYGTNESGNAKFNSFNLSSNYNLFGFGLSGGISHGNSDSLIPGVIIGGQTATANSDSTSYVFSRCPSASLERQLQYILQSYRSRFRLPGLQLQRRYRHGQCVCQLPSHAQAKFLAGRQLHR